MFETLGPSIRAVPFVKGLVNPWSLAFLPNGDMLVTEKGGQLRIVRNGTLDPQPIGGVPQVWAMGQGGLLEVAPHPRFAENQVIYLTYSKPGERGATTALARGRFDGKALTDLRDIFVADNWATGGAHFGSKIAFGRDGMLYMTVGERNDRNRAQDTTIHGGKVLRLREDGTVPPDNPFVGRSGFKPEIYSYRPSEPAGTDVSPGNGRTVGNRTRTTGRRRAQHDSARQELRLAGRHLRPRVHRGDHREPAVARRDGTAGHGLVTFDWPVGHGLLYRRSIPGVEGQPFRGRSVGTYTCSASCSPSAVPSVAKR